MLNGNPVLRRILVVFLAVTAGAMSSGTGVYHPPVPVKPVEIPNRAAPKAVTVPSTTEIVIETAPVAVTPKPKPKPRPKPKPKKVDPAVVKAIETDRARDWGGSPENGRLPDSALARLSFAPDERIRVDAAQALEHLNAEFQAAFGHSLSVSSGYRSYAEQEAVRASRGWLAARPGYSNHGLGVAVDLNGMEFGSDAYRWLREHGPAYGWDNPPQHRVDGRKPEPWHFEYYL